MCAVVNNNTETKKGESTNFEKFIKSKLNQVPTSSTGKFVLPKLSFATKLPTTFGNKSIEKSEVQIISKDISNLNLNGLHSELEHVKVSDSISDNTNSIDLTEALNMNDLLQEHNNNTKAHISQEIFDIPFLDGDIEMQMMKADNQNTLIRQTSPNSYKISNNKFNVNYKRKCNSRIGKIFKLNYYCTKNVSVDHTFKSKPLESFDFSTKSPDDKILENMQRRTFC